MAESQFKSPLSVEARAVTAGPRQHFFGYYDKFAHSLSGRYLLSHAVTFDDRPPTAEDAAVIGVIDLGAGHRFEGLAQTHAWCWRQGAMLQWHGADPEHKIIHNDRRDGRTLCFDSSHSGARQIYLMDVAAVIASAP